MTYVVTTGVEEYVVDKNVDAVGRGYFARFQTTIKFYLRFFYVFDISVLFGGSHYHGVVVEEFEQFFVRSVSQRSQQNGGSYFTVTVDSYA